MLQRPAAILLSEAVDFTGFKVDAVVIDEGQDFAPGWFEALMYQLVDPDEGPMYVFADPLQSIYRAEWQFPHQSWATWKLTS